ncbi:acyltransferase [Hyphomicrobium sp.]|uniref:acyltransferase family protein n=1 Tax=Hyphomicrobium sp. TaxID=82 RepID=UPI000FA8340F|nr:acyltransferase [Hyphomicrobium sp.]RUP08542.1 MAG: acyltransferase [Hyphomicrobium sp.]
MKFLSEQQVPTIARSDAELRSALHIPSLDGIRAVSFALVFLGHAGLNDIIPAGFGVTVFFLLSGYLITTLLRVEFEKTKTISFGKFYLRRALRILPPFYLVFLIAFLASLAKIVPPALEPASMLALLLHYSNYYIAEYGHKGFLMGTGVYWSLAVEEHFYLVFPCVLWLMFRYSKERRKVALYLLTICGLTLLWRCALWFLGGVTDERIHVATDTRFDSLILGAVLAVYENPALDQTRLSEPTWKYLLLPMGVLGLLGGFAVRNPAFRETARYTIQGLSLLPIFVCAVRYPDWLFMRLLNLRPVVFLGALSYSLYLVHLFVLATVDLHFRERIGALDTAVVSLGFSILLAWGIYIAVERPCSSFRRQLRA